MLLPALNSTRAKARSISCLSRIKQVNLVMNMYADSHDDRLPARGEYGLYWYQALELEKKKNSPKDTSYCPALETKSHNVAGKHTQTFGLNIWLSGETNNAGKARKANPKRGKIISPERKDFVANTTSGVVLFGDSIFQQGATGAFGDSPVQYVGIEVKYSPVNFDGAVHFRHPGDTANFGMLDGSAASMNFPSAYARSCITAGYKQNFTFIRQALQ